MRKLPHILSVSLWTMIQSFLALSTWFFFFLATEHLGERSLAVSNIVRSVSAVLFMPVSAYGTTANTLVSNLIGENRLSEVAPTITKIIKQCIYFVLPIMVIILLIPELIVRVYTNDFELINATLPSLMVLVFSYICATPGMIFHQSVSGTGNTRWGLIIEVITLVFYVSFVVVTAFILKTSVDICWFSEFVYWGLLFIISYLYMKKANWQSKRI